MNNDQALGTLRWALTAAAGLAVTLGYVDATTANAIVGAAMLAVGSVAALATLVWTVWTHNHANTMQAAKSAITANPSASDAQPVVDALRDAGAKVDTKGMPTP